MISVSVIIPVYNVESYVAECLESVLQQDFESFEILCVDDCSQDSSMEIVKRYAQRDKRIEIITHSCNQGLAAARNTGIKNAKGKYILFIDSDDKIIPGTLSELFALAEKNGVDIVYFDYKKIYEREMERLRNKNEKACHEYLGIYSGRELFCLFAREKNIKLEVWRQLFRKDLLLQNGICFYEGILHEDNLFSFFCAMKAKKVMNIKKEYYIYRQRGHSIMATMNEHRVISLYIVLLEIFKYWNTHEFSPYENEAISYFFESIYCSFQNNRNFFHAFNSITLGSYPERFLFELLTKAPKQYGRLGSEKISQLRKAPQVILFGAGNAACDIAQILEKEGITIDAVCVSDPDVAIKTLRGMKVGRIEDMFIYRETAVVVIGVTRKYREEIKTNLIRLGFENLMLLDE